MIELNPPFEYRGKTYKICNVCRRKLPIERFSKSNVKKSGYRGDCKYCQRVVHNKWKDKTKFSYNPEYEKNRRLKRKFGITLEYFNIMLKKQSSKCAICGKKLTGGKDTHVDHCHKTGKVRELLCSNCNTTLGKTKDNTHILELCIKYLLKHEDAK